MEVLFREETSELGPQGWEDEQGSCWKEFWDAARSEKASLALIPGAGEGESLQATAGNSGFIPSVVGKPLVGLRGVCVSRDLVHLPQM